MQSNWLKQAEELLETLKPATLKVFHQKSPLSHQSRLAVLLMADFLAKKQGQQTVGISGGQGAGKSTLSRFIAELINAETGHTVQILSLDDFYLTKAQRQHLAATLHPLFATRGVPGTHDIDLLNNVLDAIKAGDTATIPRFDKASDDRLPENQACQSIAKPDLVLLEGWCLGARPQPASELLEPFNQLERDQDTDGKWRYAINRYLAEGYANLFNRLDTMVYLQVPNIEAVRRWRNQQEQPLRDNPQPGRAVLSPDDINHFVQYFERLTHWMQQDLPARADLVLALSVNHDVEGFQVNAT
ncbi:hypothetical protein QP938_09355 [Porticoccaceae bacterium LTM1]|nr:hypothetical protein QP938_09355 [Porticoccaceae bacterium LTM1]